ncbi:MAG: hypothetical protein K2M78_17125 [Lachnospiraceae bacterium]|nr:hypothetical protein [Lachnospiraceae bacterium]
MKKSITWLLLALFLVGCGTENEKDVILPVVNNEDTVKITIQFHDTYVDVTDKDDIEQILQMFSDNKENNDEQLKDSKGWIYNLSFYDKKDNEIALVSVLDENNVRFEDKIYTCNNLSLTTIDKISEIDRYK